MRTTAATLLALAALTALVPVAAQAAPPDLPRAKAAILIDSENGEVLAAKDPRERRAMASTTKLMTALLAIENAKLTDVFTAPAYKALPVESKINLRKGERMSVEDLLEALLLESANDAAVTIAEGVAGSRPAFVAMMNKRARELGLRDTSYANPIGLDHPDNYSSPRDLAKLAERLLRNDRIAEIVDMPSATLETGARPRVVRNRNDLVGRYAFVDGVKTGQTNKAGYVLVGHARTPLGARVISVVMGEPSEGARDSDSLELLRYGLSRFRRKQVLSESKPVATAEIAHRDGTVDLVPAQDVVAVVRAGQKITTRVDAPEEVEGEMDAGERVGTIAVLRDGKVINRVPLVTASEVPGAGPLRRVVDALGALTLIVLLAMVSGAVIMGKRMRRVRRRNEQVRRRRARAQAWAAANEPGDRPKDLPLPTDIPDER